ncbi:MAG: MBL fold metallo-hydrolase [Brevinematales bacterium]|nr:MBL fold metallo-hydrolase [Brevinematales bacterium]
MKPSLSELVLLVENTTYTPTLSAKHGFSLGFSYNGNWILFDTGPDATLLENASRLHFPLEKVSHLVLSHGHVDHTGGLESLLNTIPPPSLWAHPALLTPKYRADGSFLGTTLSPPFAEIINPVTQPTEILSGFWVIPSGDIIHEDDTHFENLLVENEGKRDTDTFEDEVSIVIDHGDSLSLFTGCAHRGITNIIETVWKQFHKPFQRVVGGFHLRHTPSHTRHILLSRLASYPVSHYHVCHCTGIEAYHEMKSLMGPRVEYLSTGSTISLML